MTVLQDKIALANTTALTCVSQMAALKSSLAGNGKITPAIKTQANTLSTSLSTLQTQMAAVVAEAAIVVIPPPPPPPPPPTGTPQHPAMLTGYAVRPSWQVAGVDFAVGIPAGTVLTDWQALPQTGGLSIVGTLVRIDGTANRTIDKVDFSLHGGANLAFVNGSPGGVVTNCKFASTTPASIVSADASSPGLMVKYCEMDGLSAAYNGSGLINAWGGGAVVVQYNWMKNFPQHAVEMNFGDLDYSYNLIENGGMYPGAHYNVLQWSGGVSSAIVRYNTIYQEPQAAGGEAIQFYYNGTGSFTLVDCSRNVVIAKGAQGTSISYMIHGSSGLQYPATLTGPASITENYIDRTGAWGFLYPNSFDGWTVTGNINMVTGGAAT